MSYILDALNKAERERRLGQVPLLEATPPAVAPRRYHGWLGTGLLVGLLAATAVSWLTLRSWRPDHPGAGPAAAANSTATRPAEPVVVASHPLASTRPQPYAQLPPALRHQLGPLQLDITVFSAQPGQRFVIINDRRYRQGDWLRPGLLLQQISADGAILDYQGRRFRLNVNP